MNPFAPETCHEWLLDTAPRALAFSPQNDFAGWRQAVEAKLRELMGVLPDPVPLNLRAETLAEHAAFREIRLAFAVERGAEAVAHLLLPTEGAGPFPVVICLQGHSTGMHISLGRAKYEGDAQVLEGDRDYAIQAVRQGYAALALEQRCFGERKDARPKAVRHVDHGCHHATMVALLLGRAMIGERVWDVSRAIDALSAFPEVDTTRIGCMGNSGGGTITYFAACLEPRISVAMPSCFVCSLSHSIGRIDHCADNYLPGFLRWFELADVAGLIAPRPLIVVAGRADAIFPFAGVEAAFTTIQAIYAAAGVPENCRLVVGEGGHRFYAAESWPVFRELAERAGW